MNRRAGRVRATVALVLGLAWLPAWALEGTGFGASTEQARQRAAADLAASIQVRVQSVVENCVQVTQRKAEDCGARVVNRTSADLPLLGLRYEDIPGGSEPQGARAVLDPAAAQPLYRERLVVLAGEFAAGRVALAGTSERRERHGLLTRQIATLRALSEHRLVAVALGMKVDDLPASETALSQEREALEDTADSLPFAARLLLRDVPGTVDRVEPLVAAGSREATPFGAAMADALRVEMTGRGGPRLRVTGEYRILDSGDLDLVVEARRADTGELTGLRSVRLPRAAYAGLRAQPLAPDFERLLREGVAVSGDLRAEIVTAAGASNLLFRSGESVRLLVRLNQPGYFYVVGHAVRPGGEQFSYLLPLQQVDEPGRPDLRFVRHVPADQANHYVEIGDFEVVEPFGTEHLQIMASSEPPTAQLPRTRREPGSDYDVIDGSQGRAEKGLATTRGLRPKTQDRKRPTAEGTLTFTTVER